MRACGSPHCRVTARPGQLCGLVDIAQQYAGRCVLELNAGELTPVEAGGFTSGPAAVRVERVEDVPPGTLRAPGQWSELRGALGSSGLLYVPEQAVSGPVRLVVMFHGAGQSPQSARRILETQARDRRFALLLPRSAGLTWDAIRGQGTADLRSADALIEAAAGRVAVTESVTVAGFSDGASYALGAGTTLGRPVSEIIAFSPGFIARAGRPLRRPRIFISHGIGDPVLTIDQTSRVIVPALLDAGYDVEYREFYGGHTVPPDIADEAVDWMLSPGAAL